MRILVTGCAGYIGRALSARLREQGHVVYGLDREATANTTVDKFLQCDLLETTCYAPALREIDQICHLAAARGDWGISDEEYKRDNYEATKVLIRVARQASIKRWIFYSSVSALGPSGAPLGEEAPRRPINPYGVSKAQCEELFDEYAAKESNMDIITVRPSVVFGPRNPRDTNVFRLIDSVYRNRFLMVGRGKEIKTTSFLENLLDAHVFLSKHQELQAGQGHGIYHYVDSPAEATSTMVARIRENLGKRKSAVSLPLALASPIGIAGDLLADISKIDIPITRARIRKFCTPTNFTAQKIRELGFVQPVSNEEAIRETVEWYLTSYLRMATDQPR